MVSTCNVDISNDEWMSQVPQCLCLKSVYFVTFHKKKNSTEM